jgi:hypothetical protein
LLGFSLVGVKIWPSQLGLPDCKPDCAIEDKETKREKTVIKISILNSLWGDRLFMKTIIFKKLMPNFKVLGRQK